MRKDIFSEFKRSPKTGSRLILSSALLGITGLLLATPPMGFLVNQILAMGSTDDNIGQHVQISRRTEPGDEPWQAQLQVQGVTDFYVQRLVLAPGGHSGWHIHPGILAGTVVSGVIDFFDENCHLRTIAAGQLFFENNRVHAIRNPGTSNAELSIAYLIKHGRPRRMEADAPACAIATPIP
jgi:quercetin dioxygenase-like cupin family protein